MKPVFNRYNPPSPSVASEDGRDQAFLLDADKAFDVLPQPFRRIDKVLTEILENTWEIIERRFLQKALVSSYEGKVEKVIYEDELLLNVCVTSMCLCDAYLFMGCDNGNLISVELPALKLAAKLLSLNEIKSHAITKMTCIAHADDYAAVCILNSAGCLAVVGFRKDAFYLMLTITAGDSLATAERYFLPDDSSLLAVDWKNPDGKHWLDVYKVPKDEWLSKLRLIKTRNQSGDQAPPSSQAVSADGSYSDVDFAKPILLITIKPPVVVPCTPAAFSSALRGASPDFKAIGSGGNQVMTQQFFESLLGFSQGSSPFSALEFRLPPSSLPTVHFLKGQVGSSFGSTRKDPDDGTYNAVLVWWQHGNQLLIYAVPKSSREQETKPASVLPHASSIKLTAVSAQTDLVAAYLVTGVLAVWDRYEGQPLKVFLPECKDEIIMLHFSSGCSGISRNRLLTYGTVAGKLWQTPAAREDREQPVCLDDRSSQLTGDDAVLSIVCGPKDLLTVIWRCGGVVVYDEVLHRAICQLELFDDDCSGSASGGSLLVAYTKNHILVIRDESAKDFPPKQASRLFVFYPDRQSLLQPYFHDQVETSDLERVDSMQKMFLDFVKQTRLSDDSLRARIEKQREELMRMDWKKRRHVRMPVV